MTRKSSRPKNAVIVVHEIYGVNQHMENFSQSLREYGFDVFCPNLTVQQGPFSYLQGEIAYKVFMDKVGITAASIQIKNMIADIKDDYQKIFIVGFSVGATVSWLCSKEEGVHGVVGYYGSRIRDYTEITPKCPALLFFPHKEESFNVDELISVLNKKNIEIHKFNGQHGFGDPNSLNYNKASANQAFYIMVDFLQKHSST